MDLIRYSAALVVLVPTLVSPVFAQGVVEIDQASALGGISPFDPPGFPVRISRSGSYRLTGNLTTHDPNVHAIEIVASDVSLDLNGFVITCLDRHRKTCGAGSGDGIHGSARNIWISNGTIRGMGNDGVCVLQGRVSGVRALQNQRDGINLFEEGPYSRSSVITDNQVENNLRYGIRCAAGCLITKNTVELNTGDGINTGQNSLVRENISRLNQDGIRVGLGSVVAGNVLEGNDGDGLNLDGEGVVLGNTATGNNGFGLRLSDGSGYGQNAVSANVAGTVTGGLELNENICAYTVSCP
jgi:hypothetical protein